MKSVAKFNSHRQSRDNTHTGPALLFYVNLEPIRSKERPSFLYVFNFTLSDIHLQCLTRSVYRKDTTDLYSMVLCVLPRGPVMVGKPNVSIP